MVGRAPSEGHERLLLELPEERAAALHASAARSNRSFASFTPHVNASALASGPDLEREIATWRILRARRSVSLVSRSAARSARMRRHDVLDEFYELPTLD